MTSPRRTLRMTLEQFAKLPKFAQGEIHHLQRLVREQEEELADVHDDHPAETDIWYQRLDSRENPRPLPRRSIGIIAPQPERKFHIRFQTTSLNNYVRVTTDRRLIVLPYAENVLYLHTED